MPESIGQCTLNTPSDGYALILASGSVYPQGGPEFEAYFTIGVNALNGDGYTDRFVTIVTDDGDGADRAVGVSELKYVSAGLHTFDFLGSRSNGAGTVHVLNPSLSVVFVPFDSGVADACGASDDVDWLGSSSDFVAVQQCGIYVSTDSMAFVSANAWVGGEGTYEAQFRLGINDSVDGDFNVDRWIDIYNDGTRITNDTTSTSRIVPLKRGYHTVYFLARNASGNGVSANIWDASISILAAYVGTDPDTYEQDDTPGQASGIAVNGADQTHNFHTPGDADWIRFDALMGGVYTITTSQLGETNDTYLELFDSDGTTLLDQNDDYLSLASRIVWTASKHGVLFARVTHLNSLASGEETNYDLHVSGDESRACRQLYLTRAGNGSVPVASPSHSIGCSPGEYAAGEGIALTATPDSGWRILSWSGTNNDTADSVTNSLTMPAREASILVTYSPVCYFLSRLHTGNGSDPTALPSRSDNCGSAEYVAGATISVTATPATGWTVLGWSGTENDTLASSMNTLIMPGRNHTVSVAYGESLLPCYRLSLSHSGNGADPVATPARSDGCNNGEYVSGQDVALTAGPAAGWRVAGWAGTLDDASTSTSNSLAMPAQDYAVSVLYSEASSGVDHTTFIPMTSYHSPPPPPFPQLVNGNFDLAGGWEQRTTSGSADHVLILAENDVKRISAYSAPNLAWLGGARGVTDNLVQQISLPANHPAVQLSFRYWLESEERACEEDLFQLRIFTTDTGDEHAVSTMPLCKDTETGGWRQMVVPIGAFAGREIRIDFGAVLDDQSDVSNFYLDSVKLCDNSSQHPCD